MGLACGPSPTEPEPATPVALVPPEVVRFRLVGPGAVERWQGPKGQSATFDRRTGELVRTGSPPLAGRLEWPGLGTLAMCLGDVLAEPVAGDPGAFRALVWGAMPRWHLSLSGANRCSLEGVLVLEAVDDGIDPGGLSIEGRAWAAGGRVRAREILFAGLRADAEEAWPDLAVPARIRLLDLLSKDPEPEAAAVLNRLAEIAGDQRGDVEAALARRAPIGPAEAAPASDR